MLSIRLWHRQSGGLGAKKSVLVNDDASPILRLYLCTACCGALLLQLRAGLPDFRRLLQESQFIGVSNYAR